MSTKFLVFFPKLNSHSFRFLLSLDFAKEFHRCLDWWKSSIPSRVNCLWFQFQVKAQDILSYIKEWLVHPFLGLPPLRMPSGLFPYIWPTVSRNPGFQWVVLSCLDLRLDDDTLCSLYYGVPLSSLFPVGFVNSDFRCVAVVFGNNGVWRVHPNCGDHCMMYSPDDRNLFKDSAY